MFTKYPRRFAFYCLNAFDLAYMEDSIFLVNKGALTEMLNYLQQDTTLDRNSQQTRTKITIAQEPDFATSQRAHRTRLETKCFLKVICHSKGGVSHDVLLMTVSGTRMMPS